VRSIAGYECWTVIWWGVGASLQIRRHAPHTLPHDRLAPPSASSRISRVWGQQYMRAGNPQGPRGGAGGGCMLHARATACAVGVWGLQGTSLIRNTHPP
jgi:hypothetical protein